MEAKRFLLVKADENDADYVTEKRSISDDSLEKVREIINALKEGSKKVDRDGRTRIERIAWGTGDCRADDNDPYLLYALKGLLTIDEIEWFDQWLPHREHGIHTIESIEVIYQGERLL